MSPTDWGVLVLGFPLAGSMVIAFGRAAMPGRIPGWVGTASIGQLLLERFLIAFEAASLLLLIAAVGAVVLARRRRGLEHLDEEHEQSLRAQGAQG